MITNLDVIMCAMQIEAGRNAGKPLHDLLMVRTGASMEQCIKASKRAIAESLITMYTPRDMVVTVGGLRHISERAGA